MNWKIMSMPIRIGWELNPNAPYKMVFLMSKAKIMKHKNVFT